jgi:hypothetical protein
MSDWMQRAESAFAGLRRYFSVGSASLYREVSPARGGDPPTAYHWPFSQAMAAALDMAGLSESHRRGLGEWTRGLDHYWDGAPQFGLPGYDSAVRRPYGDGGDKYHDDNAWTGLNLLRLHRMTADANALLRARQVFALLASGWYPEKRGARTGTTGGIFWKQQTPTETNHDRNTVSTAPAAELGLRLFQLTNRQEYLDAALTMYRWVNATLRDADGLYWDHVSIGARGELRMDTTRWSYNQGTMLGANLLLHQITGEAAYLDEARTIARAALGIYGCADGCDETSAIFTQDPPFNAIFFRHLVALAAHGEESGVRAMADCAERIWNDARIHQQSKGGSRFAFEAGRARLLDQAAMTQIFACLAWPHDQYDLLV